MLYAKREYNFCSIFMTAANVSSSTIRLSNDLKRKLARIGAKMSFNDGKIRTMEHIIQALIEEHEKKDPT